jgi:hypothetical protein
MIFRAIAMLSYVNPNISSKINETVNRIDNGKNFDEIIEEIKKENDENIAKTGSGSPATTGSGSPAPAPATTKGGSINEMKGGGGVPSNILIRLIDYYNIDFELEYLDYNIEDNIHAHHISQLDNIKLTELKPIKEFHEAKYALLAAIWVIDKLQSIDKNKLDNWISFTMATKKLPNLNWKDKNSNWGNFNSLERSSKNLFGESKNQSDVTDIKKNLNQYKLKLYNDWYNKFKKDNNEDPTLTKQFNRIQYILDVQYKYVMKYYKIYESKIKDFFESDKITFSKTTIDGKKDINIKNGDNWHEDFKKLKYKTLLDILISKEEDINKLIKDFIEEKNNDININQPSFGGSNKTRKNKKGGNLYSSFKNAVSKTASSASNVVKKSYNATKKNTYKIVKLKNNAEIFYVLLDCVFLTCVSNMNKRLMKDLFVMSNNKSYDDQTGYTMQDNLILCISKTMKYILRIPFMVCMAPSSMIIGHLTYGFLASPHCFMTSHIFFSIFIKSGILTENFARKLKKLFGNIVFKIEKDIEKIYNKTKKDIVTELQSKFCAINNNFMGLFKDVEIKEVDKTKTFIFKFAYVDYNKERTQIIFNLKNQKFGVNNRLQTKDGELVEIIKAIESFINPVASKPAASPPISSGDNEIVKIVEAIESISSAAPPISSGDNEIVKIVEAIESIPSAAPPATVTPSSPSKVKTDITYYEKITDPSTNWVIRKPAKGLGAVSSVTESVASYVGDTAVGVTKSLIMLDRRGLDIYEEKEFTITLSNSENDISDKIQIVIPYVYACPTYYDTTTISSTIAKKRIHTKVSISDLFERFKKENPVDAGFPKDILFNYEYEYNGIFIGKITDIKKNYTDYLVNNTIDVSSSKSLHVIVPYDKPALDISNNEYNNKITCDLDNNYNIISGHKTKDYYISTSYGAST